MTTTNMKQTPAIGVDVTKQRDLQSVEFSISYDAPEGEYAEHQIDAKNLANAILGMHDLITEATNVISNGSAEVKLKVSAPVEEGSVIVSFIAFATSPEALTVLSYLGFATPIAAVTGGSLVALIQKLNNRKITNVTIEGDCNDATITVDGEKMVVDKRLAKLAVSPKARDALSSVIKAPLQSIKNSTFKVIGAENEAVFEIHKDATESFSPLPKGSLEDQTVESFNTTVSFSQVNFSSPHGWKMLLPGQGEKSVTLRDDNFIAKVNASQATFKKEDLYEVEVELKSTIRPTRSTHEYSIIKVVRHYAEAHRKIIK